LNYKQGLQASLGNQAPLLRDWGRLDEALALLKEQERLCQELGDKQGLSNALGMQAVILRDWGRLDEALALLKEQVRIPVEGCHQFRLKAATDSGRRLPPIPVEGCH
jgi:hypothetical protein